MLAGWIVVFEPQAVVVHSHQRGWRHDYRRHKAHAAAMEELFGFHPARTAGEAWRLFCHEWHVDATIIRQRTTGLRRAGLLIGVPLAVAARVLGTYSGRAPRGQAMP